MNKPNYKLKYEWSDYAGDYAYILYKPYLHSVTYQFIRVHEGDIEWAKRVAKHYEISVPRKIRHL